MTLFPELIISIIEELTTLDFPLAYTYPGLVLRTLLNLALVSHAVSSWTLPFIYSRIRVRSRKQLQLLHGTLCSRSSVRRRVESFAIFQPIASNQDYELTHAEVQQICDLLAAMSSSLQRLALDLPYPDSSNHEMVDSLFGNAFIVDTLLGDALSRLPHIVEFVSIRHDIFYMEYFMFPSWESLSRLALFEPIMDADSRFDNKPHVRHLVLESASHGLAEIIRMSSSLQIVALIAPSGWGLDGVAPVVEERSDIRFDLHFPDHEDVGDCEEAKRIWYRSAVEDGTLWEDRTFPSHNPLGKRSPCHLQDP